VLAGDLLDYEDPAAQKQDPIVRATDRFGLSTDATISIDFLEQSGDSLVRATGVHAKSAYWLYLAGKRAYEVEILGDLVDEASIQLEAGWHLIGPTAYDSPWGLNDDLALRWDAKRQLWRTFDTPGDLAYGVGYYY
jgi:hypothetical protein